MKITLSKSIEPDLDKEQDKIMAGIEKGMREHDRIYSQFTTVRHPSFVIYLDINIHLTRYDRTSPKIDIVN